MTDLLRVRPIAGLASLLPQSVGQSKSRPDQIRRERKLISLHNGRSMHAHRQEFLASIFGDNVPLMRKREHRLFLLQ